MILIILLVIIAFMVMGGGHTYNGGAYRRHGCGCGSLVLGLLVVLLLLGAIHA